MIAGFALEQAARFDIEVFGMAAFWAYETIRPALLEQILPAFHFITESFLEFYQRHS
jgi:hypothetical protein